MDLLKQKEEYIAKLLGKSNYHSDNPPRLTLSCDSRPVKVVGKGNLHLAVVK